MSIISNTHTSVVYESKGKNKTVAFTGQRLIVTVAKADKDGNYGQNLQQTMATSVPVLAASAIDWTLARVQSACCEYLQGVQNRIVGTRIKEDGLKSHRDEDLSVDAILAHLDAEASGDKWDSLRIASWFADVLGDYVGAKILERNPDCDNTALEKFLLLNQDAFVTACTGRKVSVKAAETALARLELLPEDKRDRAALKFIKRMQDIISPPVVAIDEAIDLGL